MSSLAARFRRIADQEHGFTLVEVLVAMMVFALIAVSVAFALTSSLVTTRDSRARAVATNLAAQDIDVSRSISDVRTVLNKTFTRTVDGITYTVNRTTGWVSSNGADATCGSNGGVLQYKHVNVRVTWTGARTSLTSVQSDTLVAPNGRLNDPTMGTILVSVLGASGAGMPGISVNVTPNAAQPNGAQTVSPTPLDTDAQGCSYVLRVAPGNYDVAISKAGGGYVSDTQTTTVTKAGQGVQAGDSTSASFQYDQASTITAVYASNSALPLIVFPPTLKANFASENAIYQTNVSVNSLTKAGAPIALHPFSNGYSIFTGNYVAASTNQSGVQQPACVSPDPNAWTTPDATGAVGKRAPSVATLPGASATTNVPMGAVTVSGVANRYVTAVSAVASVNVGDPGCDPSLKMTYVFPTKNLQQSVNIALPYGSWTLYSGNRAGATAPATATPIQTSSIGLPTGSPANTSPTIFTLDPRVIAP